MPCGIRIAGSRARLSRTSGASWTTSAAPSAMADGGGRPPSDASGTHSTSRTPGTHRIGWLVARHRGGTSPGGCQLRRGGAVRACAAAELRHRLERCGRKRLLRDRPHDHDRRPCCDKRTAGAATRFNNCNGRSLRDRPEGTSRVEYSEYVQGLLKVPLQKGGPCDRPEGQAGKSMKLHPS